MSRTYLTRGPSRAAIVRRRAAISQGRGSSFRPNVLAAARFLMMEEPPPGLLPIKAQVLHRMDKAKRRTAIDRLDGGGGLAAVFWTPFMEMTSGVRRRRAPRGAGFLERLSFAVSWDADR